MNHVNQIYQAIKMQQEAASIYEQADVEGLVRIRMLQSKRILMNDHSMKLLEEGKTYDLTPEKCERLLCYNIAERVLKGN